MSTNLTSIPISENQLDLNKSSQANDNAAIETKPAKMDSANKDNLISSIENKESILSGKSADIKSDCNPENRHPVDSEQEQESSEQKNDSLTFSTAFTISFEDDSNKKLGIKDSIRKFAPPKPHTIEKQRQTKTDQSQENSLMSIESAPGGLAKHSTPRLHSASSRSSSRKSNNSSRHSNLSESAAFLIERMLNFKPAEREPSPQKRDILTEKRLKSPSLQEKNVVSQQKRPTARSSDGVLDSEVDFCEEKSDNGTYIVGADPESDAARKQIDELFGVVKAAEASVLANSALKNQKVAENKVTGNDRQSRMTDKKQFNRERQEHINRLACRNSSRSSSSSRHEGSQANPPADQNRRNPKAASHHSRNSSCDRSQRPNHQSRPRRATSQSSRQSSNKELSDCDTRSSRSSLHNEALDAVNLDDNSPANLPSMKFNRAFALRRARLGLGEPTRIPQNQVLLQDSEQASKMINSSQRRHQINTMTYRADRSSGSASFCRDDGGRFSLRMKQNNPSGRLGLAHGAPNSRSPQHSTALESYMSKVVESKVCNSASINGPTGELIQHRTLLQRQSLAQSGYAPSGMPCQSGDEQEAPSSSFRYKYMQKIGSGGKKSGLVEPDNESDSYNNRSSYSLGQDQDIMGSFNVNESRASTSTGRRENNLQLGALDSLVISAISSLSLKIRQSVCEVLVEHAKKLPVENETRLIVEEILPQLTAHSSNSKSPTSIEEIDQSLYFDLAKTLKNLKKVEQMVEVIALISNHLPSLHQGSSAQNSNSYESNNKSDLN